MSSNNLIPFAFEENLVRVHTDEHGDPWFCVKDVCKILELGNVTEATRALDEDEKAEFSITEFRSDGIEQGRNYVFISESGIYTLVFRSRKPEAKLFRKWVTSVVLPSLRKNGGYAMPGRTTRSRLPGDIPLPEEALALRPSMREKLWNDAMQAARLDNGGTEDALFWFASLCRMMAEKQTARDEVGDFFAQCCTRSPGKREKVGDLYDAFRRWRKPDGFTPGLKSFSQSMARFARRGKSNHMLFHDVALLHNREWNGTSQ